LITIQSLRVRAGVFALAWGLAAGALAQRAEAPAEAYQPSVGQPGKDVVWVPTPQVLVDTMLDMAKLTPADRLIDLGSGDGRTVLTAARRGAPALGIELNPDLVRLARRQAEREGLAARARFEQRDLFKQDLSTASVITMFLLTEINLKLRPRLLALKPGTRIVSNTFTMGDWAPDETRTLLRDEGCDDAWCTAHLWIVPARVAGTHRTLAGTLRLVQTHQRLAGTLGDGASGVPVNGRVRGTEIELDAGGRTLRGRVRAGRLELD
jgi:SAM-dependent methyltransferase